MSLLDEAKEHEPINKRAVLGKIADLLERNGIDVEDVGRVQRVNVWQGFYKDDEGEAHTVDMAGVSLSPKWAEGPKWPLVQPAKPVRPRPPIIARKDGYWDGVAVYLPDPQIGYWRDLDSMELAEPMHDEAAMSAALAVVKAVRPSRCVHLGDLLDLASWGKFRKEPAFARTTQATLDRGHEFLGQTIEAAGSGCEHELIEGNHDKRLGGFIIDNAVEAFGLRRANTDGWPVMSIPNLLRLDDLGVTYVEGYPAGMSWLNDRVLAIHGERLKTEKVLDDEQVTVIHGHTHRIAAVARRRRTRTGAVQTWAVSPGCLCRVDGHVPSVHSGTDSKGHPVERAEDWQQGICLVWYRADGEHAVELVPIQDGKAYFRGKVLAA